MNREMNNFFDNTKRLSPDKITKVLDILNNAYFALETNPVTLADAERTLCDEPLKTGQELIIEAIESLQDLECSGLNKLDEMLYDLSTSINKINSLKIDVSVVERN